MAEPWRHPPILPLALLAALGLGNACKQAPVTRDDTRSGGSETSTSTSTETTQVEAVGYVDEGDEFVTAVQPTPISGTNLVTEAMALETIRIEANGAWRRQDAGTAPFTGEQATFTIASDLFGTAAYGGRRALIPAFPRQSAQPVQYGFVINAAADAAVCIFGHLEGDADAATLLRAGIFDLPGLYETGALLATAGRRQGGTQAAPAACAALARLLIDSQAARLRELEAAGAVREAVAAAILDALAKVYAPDRVESLLKAGSWRAYASARDGADAVRAGLAALSGLPAGTLDATARAMITALETGVIDAHPTARELLIQAAISKLIAAGVSDPEHLRAADRVIAAYVASLSPEALLAAIRDGDPALSALIESIIEQARAPRPQIAALTGAGITGLSDLAGSGAEADPFIATLPLGVAAVLRFTAADTLDPRLDCPSAPDWVSVDGAAMRISLEVTTAALGDVAFQCRVHNLVQSSPLFYLVIKVVPPPDFALTSWSPGDGSVGVAVTAVVTATTVVDLDPDSAVGSGIRLRTPWGADVASDLAVSGPGFTLGPVAPLLPNTTYSVTVPAGALTDLRFRLGKNLAADWRFTTLPAAPRAPVAGLGADRRVARVRLSPVGDVVVYIADADGATPGTYGIYKVPAFATAPGDPLHGSLVDSTDVTDLAISPDGKWTVFVADKDVDEDPYLYSIPTDNSVYVTRQISGSAALIEKHLVLDGSLTFLPDSSAAVYVATAGSAGAPRELFAAAPATVKSAWRLSGTLAAGGQVVTASVRTNPNTDRIIFQADRATAGVRELWSVKPDGSDLRRLNQALTGGGNVTAAEFTPDGRNVVFLADAETDGVFELYLVDQYGSAASLRKISPPATGGAVISDFRIAADSATVAFLRAGDREDLHVWVAATGTTANLTAHALPGTDITAFALAPDSRSAVFVADRDTAGVFELYLATLPGGAPRKLSHATAGNGVSGGAEAPVYTRDSAHVAFLGDPDGDGRRDLYAAATTATAAPALISGGLSAKGTLSLAQGAAAAKDRVILTVSGSLGMELYSVGLPTAPGMSPSGGPRRLSPKATGGTALFDLGQSRDGANVIWRVVPATGQSDRLGTASVVRAPGAPNPPDLDTVPDVSHTLGGALTAVDVGHDAGRDQDQDGDTLSYQCFFDATPDRSVPGTQNCAAIAEGLTFDSATGSLSGWNPAGAAAYDIRIRGCDAGGLCDDIVFGLSATP